MFENPQYLPLVLGLISGLVITLLFWTYKKSKSKVPPTQRPKTTEDVAKEILKASTPEDLELIKKGFDPKLDKEKIQSAPESKPLTPPESKLHKKDEGLVVTQRKDLKEALKGTRASLFGRLQSVFSSNEGISDEDMENLEEILYTSDLGPATVQRLIESIHSKFEKKELSNFQGVCEALKSEMLDIFQINNMEDYDQLFSLDASKTRPQVWMIVGVNGAGKTTTIGKLSHLLAKKGLKVLVAAGDTFRAAAGDQLKVWSDRAQVEIFSPENVKDPSAVAYDACEKAKSKEFDVLIVDTAGRLHTQDNLMEELKKMKRVVQKVIPEAPHETLLVLDSNSGQNALIQAQKFHTALEVSGVVLTKLDGTAKGGVAVGLAYEYELPIKMIGVGEGIDDLRPFDPQEFVASII